MLFEKNNRESFLKQYNRLSASLLKDLLKNDPEENVIISPFSILMLLTIAAESTSGETKAQITDHLCGKMDYQSFLNEMLNSGNAISGKKFRSANVVCVNSKIRDSVSEEYINYVNSILHGKFFSSGDIVRDVNEWVKEITGGKIDQIADDSVNNALLCLLNAVTFTDKWDIPYEKYHVKDDFFTSFDGKARICRMMKCTEFSYVEGRSFTGFTKYYKNGKFSFMALLPKEEGKEKLIRLLSNRNFSNIYRNQKLNSVFTSLPKFKYGFSADLTAYCKKNGLEKIFSTQADFSPVTPENLMANSVAHKAYIDVNERGTSAGSASVMWDGAFGRPKRVYEVHLNRPFIFAIIHDKTMLPVFLGVVNYIDKDAEIINSEPH